MELTPILFILQFGLLVFACRAPPRSASENVIAPHNRQWRRLAFQSCFPASHPMGWPPFVERENQFYNLRLDGKQDTIVLRRNMRLPLMFLYPPPYRSPPTVANLAQTFLVHSHLARLLHILPPQSILSTSYMRWANSLVTS